MSPSPTAAAPLEVLLEPDALNDALAHDATEGLGSRPYTLPPKYFYDERGSALFEDITRLPEYYPTRAERGLLVDHAVEIVATSQADVLLELGSGSSEKTSLLLDAFGDGLRAYVPVDVSPSALQGAVDDLAVERPDLPVLGVVADFDRHLPDLPRPGRRLVAFLGGTIGNLDQAQRAGFLATLQASLAPGETVLLGVDLVKDPERLVAAYDDTAGVTAEFNLNVLRVLARELDADLDPADFEHVALWNPDDERIEMRLRARRSLTGRLGALGLEIELEQDEEIRTEISSKFRRERIEAELTAQGLDPSGWWTDGDYALVLAVRQ